MEYMPDCVQQIIHNYVPHSTYDYMDGLVELFVIAEETGVTPLGRLQLERAMRISFRVLCGGFDSLPDLPDDEEEMMCAALYGGKTDIAN